MKKFITPILIFVLISFFFRLYRAPDLFLYSHDQDLIGWFVKDIVHGNFRLIGQETSTSGIYIGPYFYYFLVPFYLLFGMDPIGGVFAVSILGALTTFSFYIVFKKIFSIDAGYLAAFFHSTSYFLSINEREVVPTQPLFLLFCIWFFYGIYLIFKNNNFGYLLIGLLVGLIWHVNMGLILLIPLVFISILLSKKIPSKKSILYFTVSSLFGLLPLILFELRNNFLQSRYLFLSVTTSQSDTVYNATKLERTLYLAYKNITNLFIGQSFNVSFWLPSLIILLFFGFLIYKRVLNKNIASVLVGWILMVITFFANYSKILSEYYLNSLNFVWMLVIVMFILYLFGRKKLSLVGVFLVLFLSFVSVFRFISHPINASGYIQRKQIVNYINEDSKIHGYPCISISYITQPGYNLGYRYLFYIKNMHVNLPASNSPVYTIVFPHSMVDKIDKSFGALGLILPDYKKYENKKIDQSCSGENQNLTEPLFGYTN